MTNAILRGKPDAGNPHVRFDEGEVASAKPRRGSLLYKNQIMLTHIRSAVAAGAVVFGLLLAQGVCAADLKWIGGADNNLGTGANWEGGSTAALTGAGCTIDLSEVPDGTTLNNNLGTIKLTGVKMGESQGTVTLSGGDSQMLNPAFTLPAGATLVYAVNVPNNVDWTAHSLSVTGGGTLRITAAQFWLYGSSSLTVGSGSTLDLAKSLGSTSGLCMTKIILSDSTARLTLSDNAQVNTVYVADGSQPNVNLNGYTLTMTGGMNGALQGDTTGLSLSGAIVGNGGLTLTGAGALHRITGPVTGVKTLTVGGASVELGESGVLPADAEVSVTAHGMLKLASSQTIGSLKGRSTTGGVVIPEGASLTVSGDGDASYADQLTGAGSFVKQGAGTLTLSGKTALAGGVRVEAGTVRLSRQVGGYRSDILRRYDFERADNLAYDSVSKGSYWVSMPEIYSLVPDGVSGKAVHSAYQLDSRLAHPANSYIEMRGTIENTQDHPFTVSLWIRPDNVKEKLVSWGSEREIFMLGEWNNYRNLRLWMNMNDKLVFSCNDWSAGVEADFSAVMNNAVTLTDGCWHHVVGVYEDKKLKLYADGRLVATKQLAQAISIGDGQAGKIKVLDNNSDGCYAFGGDIDELVTSDQAWTDADVLAEFNRRSAHADVALPPLAARWTFDEVVDGKFKDLGPNGNDLKTLSANASDSISARNGAYGKAYQGWQGQWRLTLADGTDFPVGFPSGNEAWTVSVRATGDGGEGSPIIQWGDMSTIRKHVKMTCFSNPCQLACDVNGPWAVLDGMSTTSYSSDDPSVFSHVIFSYNPSTGEILQWRDGRFVMKYGTEGALDVTPSGFCLQNASTSGSAMGYYGYIDDVAVYKGTFTDAQARYLTETLKDGTQPGLDKQTPVSVSVGATLALENGRYALADLTGAGTVEVGSDARLVVDGANAFAGQVVGNGGLVELASGGSLAAATVSADVTLQDGVVVNAASLPAVYTTGRLTVPVNGTVDVSSLGAAVEPGKYVIAHGGKVLAGDLGGWKVTGAGTTGYDAIFFVENGDFIVKLKLDRTIIVIR